MNRYNYKGISNAKINYIVDGANIEIFSTLDGLKKIERKFPHTLLRLLNSIDEELKNITNNLEQLSYIVSKSKLSTNDIKSLKKAKHYIDKAIANPFYSQYNIFKIACELKYFKTINPLQHLNLNEFDNLQDYENTTLDDYYDRLERIYKYYNETKMPDYIKYEITDLEDFIVASMSEIFRYNMTIKKCENCNKYFLVMRKDAKYCENISPQDNEKTCKKYMIDKNYKDKINKDEIKSLHRKIYKRLHKDQERNKRSKYIKNFNDFKEQSKLWQQQIKEGKKTKEEYYKWLKEVDNKKRQ